jgi:hypothetical protein
MTGKKRFTIYLTRDVSKKNNVPFWVSGEINIRTVMDELGATKVCMEIPGKIEDGENTLQLNFKPAWADKMQKLEEKSSPDKKFKNVSVPMWFRENVRKNGEKVMGNNSPNYNILDLQDLLGPRVQARVFLNRSPNKKENSPSLNVSFGAVSKKGASSQQRATEKAIPNDDSPF